MSHDNDGAIRILRLLACRLEEYLEGDELALETLGEALEQEETTADDLNAAILGLRGLAQLEPPSGWVAGTPALNTQRMLSAEERDSLTTEAWGYLWELRSHGTLDAEQFERVLEALTVVGDRPVELERAREIASRIALEVEESPAPTEFSHGDQEVAH